MEAEQTDEESEETDEESFEEAEQLEEESIEESAASEEDDDVDLSISDGNGWPLGIYILGGGLLIFVGNTQLI